MMLGSELFYKFDSPMHYRLNARYRFVGLAGRSCGLWSYRIAQKSRNGHSEPGFAPVESNGKISAGFIEMPAPMTLVQTFKNAPSAVWP